MGTEIINIKSENLFPWHFHVFAIVLIIVSIIAFPNSPLFSPFLIIISVCVLTGYSGIQFDRKKKSYRTYYSILFINFGKWKQYNSITVIYINAATVSQKIITRVTEGSTIRSMEYNAYLEFDNGDKEFITSGKDKQKLYKIIQPLVNLSNTEFRDNTI